MNVLVTGAGSRIGQAVIRLINCSKQKHRIVAADYFGDSVGFFWSSKYYILPDILKTNVNQKNWLYSIEKIVKKNGINLIIPGVDFELSLFSKFKSFLEKKYNLKVIISDPNVINIFNNKLKTYNFLKNNNIDCAYTCKYSSRSFFFKYIKNNKYILKPSIGHTSRNVFLLKNKKNINHLSKNIDKPILQEYLSGSEYTCGTIIQNKYIFSNIILKRKLKHGNTILATRVDDHEIVDYINKIVKASNFFGPINFQLIKTKDGPRLLEINPRFSGTSYTRYLFGLNEFDVLVKILKNRNFSLKKFKNGTVIKYTDDFFISEKKNKFI